MFGRSANTAVIGAPNGHIGNGAIVRAEGVVKTYETDPTR